MKPRHFWWLVAARGERKKEQAGGVDRQPLSDKDASRLLKWAKSEQKHAA